MSDYSIKLGDSVGSGVHVHSQGEIYPVIQMYIGQEKVFTYANKVVPYSMKQQVLDAVADGTPAIRVSTHSRPKAAGCCRQSERTNQACFNSQPPEGGWVAEEIRGMCVEGFNSQPPEGGWIREAIREAERGGFNSQPPEGGWTTPQCCSTPH